MKNFKVILNIGGASFIPAESWERDGEWYKFYRHGAVIAEFAALWVVRIEERDFQEPSDTASY